VILNYSNTSVRNYSRDHTAANFVSAAGWSNKWRSTDPDDWFIYLL